MRDLSISETSKMLVESIQRSFVKNRILGNLPLPDLAAIGECLEPIVLTERVSLQSPRKPVEFVYFIESGIVSQRIVDAGSIFETALVGYRGAIGLSSLFGGHIPTLQSVVLFPGHALRIPRHELRQLMEKRPQVSEYLLRHVEALTMHGAQTGLCGVRHHLEQRLACWLCLACDAYNSDVLPVTHDYLADALGLRRAGVTDALSRLEGQGLVHKMRGILRVSDRKGLEEKACGCYGLIAKTYAAAEHETLAEYGGKKDEGHSIVRLAPRPQQTEMV
jgi:CRP-like cAMP-binding protein